MNTVPKTSDFSVRLFEQAWKGRKIWVIQAVCFEFFTEHLHENFASLFLAFNFELFLIETNYEGRAKRFVASTFPLSTCCWVRVALFCFIFQVLLFLTHLVPFNIFWRHSSMLVYNNFPPWNFSLKIVNCFPRQTTSNETIFHFFFINFFIFAHIFSQKLECALFNPCVVIGNVSF